MNFIKWNFKQGINEFLDPNLRTPKRLLWLETLISQIKTSYDNLVIRRDDNVYLAKHTFQVASIEHLLNEKINVIGKPIVIEDSIEIPYFYIGTDYLNVPDTLRSFAVSSTETLEYYIFNIFVPSDNYTGIVPQQREVYISSDSIFNIGSDVTFIVKMDYTDFSDFKKVEKVMYYVNLYKPAGKSFVVIGY